jgi:3-phenylpropionate/trans-cinnamate dioxygenase ferredoxin reductase subunit
MQPGIVIVGGGQAGLEAAAGLRTLAYDGSITIIGEEPHLPYQRPPLSKDYLLGKQDAASLALRAEIYYEKHAISLVLAEKVVAIDRKRSEVEIGAGARFPYSKLILAAGARNRLLSIPGSERVLYLRTRDEAERIKERLKDANRVVVIGGGFIGLELAAAARMLGKSVTVIEAAPRLMARAVAPVLSDFFRELHSAEGVSILTNTEVGRIENDFVILADGREIPADLVLAGIGIIPNIDLARDAGLDTANGIVVDEFLRTSDPDIYAIGDCSEHPNRFAAGRIRLESVQNAVDQARCAARGITGNLTPYRDVPWVWTDQFGIRFQMVGLCAGYDTHVVRGNIEKRKFSAFYFQSGRLIAVDSVNRFGDHIAARKLLAAGKSISPAQAADETIDLKKLAI